MASRAQASVVADTTMRAGSRLGLWYAAQFSTCLRIHSTASGRGIIWHVPVFSVYRDAFHWDIRRKVRANVAAFGISFAAVNTKHWCAGRDLCSICGHYSGTLRIEPAQVDISCRLDCGVRALVEIRKARFFIPLPAGDHLPGLFHAVGDLLQNRDAGDVAEGRTRSGHQTDIPWPHNPGSIGPILCPATNTFSTPSFLSCSTAALISSILSS